MDVQGTTEGLLEKFDMYTPLHATFCWTWVRSLSPQILENTIEIDSGQKPEPKQLSAMAKAPLPLIVGASRL